MDRTILTLLKGSEIEKGKEMKKTNNQRIRTNSILSELNKVNKTPK